MTEKRIQLRFYTQSRTEALSCFDVITDSIRYPAQMSKSMNSNEYYVSAWLTQAEIDLLGLMPGKRIQDIYFVPPSAADH